MGSLQRQYQQDTEDKYALETLAHHLCEHPHLEKRDIVDRGVSIGSNGRAQSNSRFVIKEPLLTQITNVIAQMQELCNASSEILGEKKKRYVLDPDNTMLPILSAASTVGELERAWRLLVQRIMRAQEKLDRNFKKYKHEEVPLSPASTDPQLYDFVQKDWDADAIMTHLYNQPSMARLLTEEERSRLAQGKTIRSALASPIELQTAFPPRKLEALPSDIFYNDDGARIHAVDPDSLIPRRLLKTNYGRA